MAVLRWDIITIGNISRNRYWGESDERGVRPALCTCTLITLDDGTRILVDPSIRDEAAMRAELDRRAGLKPEQINAVFLTHEHGDHHFGLRHFPHARWIAAPRVAGALNASGEYAKTVEEVETGMPLFGCLDLVHTPGHTLSHHSLCFECDGFCVVIAADAAMTREFWQDRRGYFNSVDPDLAAQIIDSLAAFADIVVPGHDNYFFNQRHNMGTAE